MGRYVARLADDKYCEWSTVVDCPVSWVVDRERAIELFTLVRVARADRNGTSILDGYPAGSSPEEIVCGNRAGENETELTLERIIAAYDENEPALWTVAPHA